MKRIFYFLTFAVLLSFNGFAQTNNNKQSAIALEFTQSFVKKDYSVCWRLFDKSANPMLDSSMFWESLQQLSASLPPNSEKLEIYMSGVKFIQGRQAPFYSIKYANDVSKPAGFLFDVLFFGDTSRLVAGFQPKGMMQTSQNASTSKGNETTIAGKQKIVIEGREYHCRGVNIVHFSGNSGVIAIQIEKELPTDLNPEKMEAWAKSRAIKFAQWLYNSEYYPQGIDDAKEVGISLLNNIGVSFINPSTGAGFNVMVEETDYK